MPSKADVIDLSTGRPILELELRRRQRDASAPDIVRICAAFVQLQQERAALLENPAGGVCPRCGRLSCRIYQIAEQQGGIIAGLARMRVTSTEQRRAIARAIARLESKSDPQSVKFH